jgi:hypothetical protein
MPTTPKKRHPGLLGNKTVGTVADEAANDAEAKQPVQFVLDRGGLPPGDRRYFTGIYSLHCFLLVSPDTESLVAMALRGI